MKKRKLNNEKKFLKVLYQHIYLIEKNKVEQKFSRIQSNKNERKKLYEQRN